MDKATLHLEVPYDDRYFSPAARSLLRGLLTRDPSRRLGSRGVEEIKVCVCGGRPCTRMRIRARSSACVYHHHPAVQNHPFFRKVDWGLLAAGLIPPPWVPETSINAAGALRVRARVQPRVHPRARKHTRSRTHARNSARHDWRV